MSDIINRDWTNAKGETLDCQTNNIRRKARLIFESCPNFEFFERNGKLLVWLDLNRERAQEILDRLDSIEKDFIEQIED